MRRSAVLVAASFLCIAGALAGCSKPSAPAGGAAGSPGASAGPPAATTPAEGGWVSFEFPGEGFTVELVGPPTLQKPLDLDDGPPGQEKSEIELQMDEQSRQTKIYRTNGPKFSTDVIVSPMLDPGETPEKAADFDIQAMKTNFPDVTTSKVSHAGMPGTEHRIPARGSGPIVERNFFRNGKEIKLQFNMKEKVDADTYKADRERFFNSLKLKT